MPGFKFKTSVVTLTTAGTAYQASTGYLPLGTVIQPATGNTGTIYIGAAGVTSSTGYLITSSNPLRLSDLEMDEAFFGPSIYFVGTQNGDKVVLLIPEKDNTAV